MNKYGEMYREQIIRSTIRDSRPTWLFGWFSICPVTDAQQILNCKKDNDAYRLLRAYHCVNYYTIPRAIRKRIPELVREALTPEDVGF